jgi:hypothetical protein
MGESRANQRIARDISDMSPMSRANPPDHLRERLLALMFEFIRQGFGNGVSNLHWRKRGLLRVNVGFFHRFQYQVALMPRPLGRC